MANYYYYTCKACNAIITEKRYNDCLKIYNTPLCIDCQIELEQNKKIQLQLDNKPHYYKKAEKKHICLNCHNNMSEKEYNYSKENWNICLCYDCQQWLKNIEQQTKISEFSIRLYFILRENDIPAELEKFDGYKHIDIAIPKAKINIEVDGSHHNLNSKQALSDLKRTCYSMQKGYTTIRIPNSLMKDLDKIEETAIFLIETIRHAIKQNKYY